MEQIRQAIREDRLLDFREEFFTIALNSSEEEAKNYILNKYPRMMPYINGCE